MAKHYTEEASTPIFAVTFVTNRKGIVPELINATNTNQVDNTTQIKKIEDEIKVLDDYINGIVFSDSALVAKEKAKTEKASLQLKLSELSTQNTSGKSNVQDTEYIVYSNVQIQAISDTDLSQQSNWYLRDAEVEVTRDWPICKAKLIVTCKLNEDGTIPSLIEVEKGFVYTQTNKEGDPTGKKNEFTLLPEGRFLSADDEVRIYAGYKSDTCITMNDLDQYPFSFKSLDTKSLSPTIAAQLECLQKEANAVRNAISALANPFTDPTGASLPLGIATIGGVAIAALAALGLTAVVVGGTTTAGTGAVTTISTGAVTSTALSTEVLSEGATLNGATQVAGRLLPSATKLDALAQSAYSNAIAKGLGRAAASTAAINVVLAGAAFADNQKVNIPCPLRDYLNGRQSYKDNKELADQLQFELNSINNLISTLQRTGGIQSKENVTDPNKPLAPIFWGFIDSVDFIGNSSSIQIIYNLRDRSRILADTKIITIPFLNAGKDEKGAFEGLRHKTIEGVYRAANGGIYLDNSYKSATTAQWRENFNLGSVITLWDNVYKDSKDTSKGRFVDQVKSIDENIAASANERIKFNAAIEDPARWVIANSFLPNDRNPYDPLFHIWTLQPPLVSGSGPTTMQIINKAPFEILSYMSMTEVMPMDFFCSHVNGHFMFAPRVLDTTGLNDVDRGNRLYFFFDCFDRIPESRSVIKEIRVTTSTIGIYNRFTVSSADFNNPTNASLNDISTIVDISSANTKNKKIPIKQHIIVDPKIKDASKELTGSSTTAAAQALALTTASTMGRDNTTIIMKVIGDSSFYPGEAIRVYNTVLHNKGILTFNGQQETQANFLKALYDKVQEIKKQAITQTGEKDKVVNLNSVIEQIRGVGTSVTDPLTQVLPMYKVRSITHSLKAGGNDAGYTTKIVAIADIL